MTGSGNRRQAQKEETRRLIKKAAYDLFEAKGYEATTMRLLAARAGVGLGTIFQHFPDKPALLSACFLEDIDRVTGQAFAGLPERGLLNQLLHLTRTFYTFYAERPLLFRVLLQGLVFQQTDQTTSRLNTDLGQFLGRVAGLAVQARERGELGQDLDPGLLASAFWSFYVLGLQLGLQREKFDIQAQIGLVEGLLRQHLKGFLREE